MPDRYGLVERKTDVTFIKTGCTLFDCAIGGGYARGRMINLVGDRSSGKTLLATEAATNYHRDYPKGRIRYEETEAAFDMGYAESIGAPISAMEFPPKFETVEELHRDFETFINEVKHKDGGLYIVDSMDALSDEYEMSTEVGKASYGGTKPKAIGTMFRKLVRRAERKNITLIIVSQVRENIGVTFGEKYRRSGGKALDFYASQIIWLSQIGKIKVKRKGVERSIGIDMRINCKKNKVAPAHREMDIPIMFDYGMDNEATTAFWLAAVGHGKRVGIANTEAAAAELVRSYQKLSDEEFAEERGKLDLIAREVWGEVEALFKPTRKKYS